MASELSLKTPSTGLVTLSPADTATDKTITLPATDGTMVVQDGTNTTTVTNLAVTNVTASGTVNVGNGNISPQTGFKNRIINGAMTIDQRNAGASVNSIASANVFCADRWFGFATSPATFSMQQVADAPTDFINSVKVTVTSADSSLAASDFNSFRYIIEGFNVADLGWGTAAAQAITLSFCVRSSLTGTFTVGIRNSTLNRSYVATYSITAANTWETKTITIQGDISGTWLKTNGVGIRLDWSLGCGSDFQGTASAWTATNDMTTAGATSVVGTSGATFYVTGVQLEKGSTATPFEFRSIGTELALCQRYGQGVSGVGRVNATNGIEVWCKTPVEMRATPTAIIKTGAQGYQFGRAASALSSMSAFYLGAQGAGLLFVSADTAMTPGLPAGCLADVAFLSAEL